MRKSFFGDIIFYQNRSLFERLAELNTNDIISVFEKIYESEMMLPEADKDKTFLKAHMKKVLEGTVFSDRIEQVASSVADSYDRLITFDRTFLLTIMHKPTFFQDHFVIKGMEKVEKVMSQYGGAVITLAHAGPHIIMIHLLSKLNNLLPLTGCGHMPDDLYNGAKDFMNVNGFANAELLRFGDNFFNNCLENLKRNRLLLLYPEYSRSQQRAGATTNFLGKTVNMPLGASRLSYQSNKAILPAYIKKKSAYQFELEFGEIIPPAETDNLETHAANTQKVFKYIEQNVISNPQDWEGWQYYEFMSKHVGEGVVEKNK